MTMPKQAAVEAPPIETPEVKTPRGLAAARDRWLLSLLSSQLSGVSKGELRLIMPSGASASFGSKTASTPSNEFTSAELRLNSFGVVPRAIRRGMVGFAESYMNREIETPDLGAVFDVFLENFEAFDAAGGGWFRTRLGDRLAHRRRANTKEGSRRNIAAHYDLGNDFYAPWLDASMMYSSGIYETPGDTLETAQDTKIEAIVEALDIRPGHRVLEIGCGWGAMAERLARAGCHVTAITLSREQLAFTKRRVAEQGLSERVDVRFEDYRDVTGMFDRIVSVEMIEAVGEEHWPVYFATLSERLKPGGHAVLQAITINEDSFETYRRNPDFIQRYIFPGGMLPTVAAMEHHAVNNACDFSTLRQFRKSYAATLRAWRERFEAAWPQIQALGFDDRFYRMWIYYLTYCEIGFDRGIIDVGLYEVPKPA